MTSRPAQLPDFEKPPLNEVALSIQFKSLDNFRTVDTGPLWDVFRDEFPKFQEQPALEPAFETFGPAKASPRIRFQELSALPIPRLWFIDKNEAQIIQFQIDRFVHNWRKVGEGEEYPRYEAIRTRFEAEIEDLNQFLDRSGFGRVEPNQAEITYVNIIPSASGGGQFNPWEVLRFWQGGEPVPSLHFENMRTNLRFLIRSDEDVPVGRLFVNAEPIRTAEDTTSMRLTLVARGPANGSVASALEFLDLGREQIVSGFADLTTSQMHKLWKRKQ